jgi:hypothetical protein
MSADQEGLWRAAAAACARLAASLTTDEPCDVSTVQQLRKALTALDAMPDSAPTADFLREAAAAAAAAASLAAGAKSVALPADDVQLLRLVDR